MKELRCGGGDSQGLRQTVIDRGRVFKNPLLGHFFSLPLAAGSSFEFLFRPEPVDHHRAGNVHRRIGADQNAGNHGECKIIDDGAAKNKKRSFISAVLKPPTPNRIEVAVTPSTS